MCKQKVCVPLPIGISYPESFFYNFPSIPGKATMLERKYPTKWACFLYNNTRYHFFFFGFIKNLLKTLYFCNLSLKKLFDPKEAAFVFAKDWKLSCHFFMIPVETFIWSLGSNILSDFLEDCFHENVKILKKLQYIGYICIYWSSRKKGQRSYHILNVNPVRILLNLKAFDTSTK